MKKGKIYLKNVIELEKRIVIRINIEFKFNL